ncbi:unnamed protein product [Debaryomyces tyrocola]|nr:unnamed protein product [Debaryomyces tyrocola]
MSDPSSINDSFLN